MAVKVGINGVGRIGKCVLRAALHNPDVDVVAINDLGDPKTLAVLIKYDSVHGNMPEEVTVDGDNLVIDGKKIRIFSEREILKVLIGQLKALKSLLNVQVFSVLKKQLVNI